MAKDPDRAWWKRFIVGRRRDEKKGSFALEESLVQLISKDRIDREAALLCANHPDDLDILLKTGSRG